MDKQYCRPHVFEYMYSAQIEVWFDQLRRPSDTPFMHNNVCL